MRSLARLVVAAPFVLGGSGAVLAEEITILASNGFKAAMHELAPQFEKQSGHKVSVTWGSSNNMMKQAEEGKAFDAVILIPSHVDGLIEQGKVVDGSRVILARVGLGVAVRQGSPKPDISTVDAFKKAMQNATGVAYTTTGQSGQHFLSVIEKLGIAEPVKAKSKTLPQGDVAVFVAKGEADIAVQLLPELGSVAGVEVVGPFPAELQSYIVMAGGIGANAKDKKAVQALMEFLTSPAALPAIKAKGMEPG